MKRLEPVTVAGSYVEEDADGRPYAVITLHMPIGEAATILAGLFCREIALDVEATLATQPDPQIATLVPMKKRRKKEPQDG